MDLQQKQPEQTSYNQCNYHQQINFKDRFKEISSLDALTEYAITSLTEKAPSYSMNMRKHLRKRFVIMELA